MEKTLEEKISSKVSQLLASQEDYLLGCLPKSDYQNQTLTLQTLLDAAHRMTELLTPQSTKPAWKPMRDGIFPLLPPQS
jgi:hypothetical protein